jgi:hypothetical protein
MTDTITKFESEYRGVTFRVERESDPLSAYPSRHTVWVDEHDGLSRWGKSFSLYDDALIFIGSCEAAIDLRAERADGGHHSLYLDACMLFEGLSIL